MGGYINFPIAKLGNATVWSRCLQTFVKPGHHELAPCGSLPIGLHRVAVVCLPNRAAQFWPVGIGVIYLYALPRYVDDVQSPVALVQHWEHNLHREDIGKCMIEKECINSGVILCILLHKIIWNGA